ncbi:MAG: 2-amino-4-hydroxy-6-hydroxymethyldihydropteridine diphosphokinase, partial [Pirellulales bacterium]|nr:2-amino-4-hydroxy-6-hydroxymethyldihydropteridine diphosphokinase [Pirellulales bacterium]
MTDSKKSLLSLGSNMGNPKKNIRLAVQKIAGLDGVQALRESRYRKSMPVGGPSAQAEFVNAAIEVSTTLDPQELLSAIIKIEQELGRERKQRWDERIIDIDILTWDKNVQSSPRLNLP